MFGGIFGRLETPAPQEGALPGQWFVHPPEPWRPPLWYRLLHPRSWRRTQAAALALMPPDPPIWELMSTSAVNISSAGSGYSSPPTITFSDPL
jgi:hypothetical protein